MVKTLTALCSVEEPTYIVCSPFTFPFLNHPSSQIVYTNRYSFVIKSRKGWINLKASPLFCWVITLGFRSSPKANLSNKRKQDFRLEICPFWECILNQDTQNTLGILWHFMNFRDNMMSSCASYTWDSELSKSFWLSVCIDCRNFKTRFAESTEKTSLQVLIREGFR